MALSDLQQYSPSAVAAEAANAENALTADYKIPTDGKPQTADSITGDKSPTNPSKKKIRDMVAGLRGALFGNVTGINKRSLFSLWLDGTGGAISSEGAGTLRAQSTIKSDTGDIVAVIGDFLAQAGDFIAAAGQVIADLNITTNNGDLIAEVGNVLAKTANSVCQIGLPAGQRTVQSWRAFAFEQTGSGVADANPPLTTALLNQLRALNTVKAWCTFTSDGAVGPGCVISDGANIASIVKDTQKFTITFAAGMANANYAVVKDYEGAVIPRANFAEVKNKTLSGFEMWTYDAAVPVDPVLFAAADKITFHVLGRQNS